MKQSLPKTSVRRFNLTCLCKGFLLAVAFLPLQLLAQKKIVTSPINKASVPSLSNVFKNYSVYSIDAPALASHAKANAKKNIDVEFDFAGLPSMQINIEENEILSSDYKLIVGSSTGQQEFNKPAVMTYRGTLANDINSNVYLTITDQTVFGTIKGKGKEYYIEPLRYFSKAAPPGAFVVYESKDVIPNSGLTCGSTEASQKTSQLQNDITQRATGTCKMVEVAIASDYSMLSKYGSASIVQERNIGIMNLMVGIYHEAQFGTQYLEFKILTQYVAATASTNPFSPIYNGNDADVMLNNFVTWAKFAPIGFHGRYDMAQLWTATNIAVNSDPSVVGYANVGQMCTGDGCQVLEDFGGSALAKAAMAGHETGHTLNADHDLNFPSIMSPSLSDPPYTNFSVYTIPTIAAYLSGSGGACLSPCYESVSAQFSSSSNAVCLGNAVTFTDYSVGEVTSRSWQFGQDANPATSNAEIVNVTYSTPGIKQITLTAVNANSSASIQKNIVVGSSPVNCRINGESSIDYGILVSFALGNINMSKSNVYISTGQYEDKSCTDMTALVPGDTYTATASIGTSHLFSGTYRPTKLQVMLDYNNDGDFLDANESVYYTPECSEGKIQFPITIPEFPPVVNQFLRLRVMALPCSLQSTDGCTIPLNAQVSDFSVYFACTNIYYRDLDVDFYGDPNNSVVACSRPPGYVTNNGDCDDSNPLINPLTQWIIDNDNDGYYSGSPVTQCTSPGTAYIVKITQRPGDCNDNDPAVNAGTTEVCANGKDDNCNGAIDETSCSPCLNATDLTTSNITNTTAKLNWVAIANPLIWELRYKKTGQGTQWITLPQMTGNIRSVNISSLVANSTYNWQIRAKCGNAWTKYTDVATFITLSLLNLNEVITRKGIETDEMNAMAGLTATAMPNPSHNSFIMTIKSNNKHEKVMMQVVDILGRIIEIRSINADQSVQIGQHYKEGFYIVRFMQGKEVRQMKLIKLPG